MGRLMLNKRDLHVIHEALTLLADAVEDESVYSLRAANMVQNTRTRVVDMLHAKGGLDDTLKLPRNDAPTSDEQITLTVTRSAGDDRAVLVLIDTTFEPNGTDDGPGLRILVNDDEAFVGKGYDFGGHHEAKSASITVNLDKIPLHRTGAGMKIELLHERDPDSECSTRVWVDGVEVTDIYVDDIDPGRGYTEEDWQSNIQQVLGADTSPDFKRAALAAYTESGDSEYVSPAPNTECRHCGRRIVNASTGGYLWVDPEAPLDSLDEHGNLTDDGIWREMCGDNHDSITAEHEPGDDTDRAAKEHSPVDWFLRGAYPRCSCSYAPHDNGLLNDHWADQGLAWYDDHGTLRYRPVET